MMRARSEGCSSVRMARHLNELLYLHPTLCGQGIGRWAAYLFSALRCRLTSLCCRPRMYRHLRNFMTYIYAFLIALCCTAAVPARGHSQLHLVGIDDLPRKCTLHAACIIWSGWEGGGRSRVGVRQRVVVHCGQHRMPGDAAAFALPPCPSSCAPSSISTPGRHAPAASGDSTSTNPRRCSRRTNAILRVSRSDPRRSACARRVLGLRARGVCLA